jgi:hypothetical protein
MTRTIIKRQDIIWALQHRDKIKANDILRDLSSHPRWSETVLHRCPLCGYETDVTNIHRHCPKTPFDKTVSDKAPEYMRHMAVPMYVVDKENVVVIE